MTKPSDVIAFWKDAGFARWFGKDNAFDAEFRARFLQAHEAAASGKLGSWADTAEGALALILLLDQFPRNAFRDTARMFATDAQALTIADAAIAAGHDLATDPALRLFFYLPHEHSERLEDQERAVALITPLGSELLRYAEIHRDVVLRFGRFPHRNSLLGRVSTPQELEFLAAGGFSG